MTSSAVSYIILRGLMSAEQRRPYLNELVVNSRMLNSPLELFKDHLHTLLEIESTEVDAWDLCLRGEPLYHLDGQIYSKVFDQLVVVLGNARSVANSINDQE